MYLWSVWCLQLSIRICLSSLLLNYVLMFPEPIAWWIGLEWMMIVSGLCTENYDPLSLIAAGSCRFWMFLVLVYQNKMMEYAKDMIWIGFDLNSYKGLKKHTQKKCGQTIIIRLPHPRLGSYLLRSFCPLMNFFLLCGSGGFTSPLFVVLPLQDSP